MGYTQSSLVFNNLLTPLEYSWTVPYDMETLISFMGGPQNTEARLDTMFVPGLKTTGTGTGGGNGIGNTLFNPGMDNPYPVQPHAFGAS